MLDVSTRHRDPGAVSGGIPAICVQGLSHQINGVAALSEVSFEAPRGTCTVVMGPNGAGKSVLLRLIHGLLPSDPGKVKFPKNTGTPPRQAMVFQKPVLLRRSVRANLDFALSRTRLGKKEKNARVAQMLSKANLTGLDRRPARSLSGGEQQRLAVARALICEPDILFMDEPTASLDPDNTHVIETMIDDAKQKGITILLVTHDCGQALRLGDHLVFMQNGRIVETGPASVCLSCPMSPQLGAWLQGRLWLR